MRRHTNPTVYAELVCVIPGQGLQTLFRCTTYGAALAFRANNALRHFQGHKVSAVERRSENFEKTGWLYQENLKQVCVL